MIAPQPQVWWVPPLSTTDPENPDSLGGVWVELPRRMPTGRLIEKRWLQVDVEFGYSDRHVALPVGRPMVLLGDVDVVERVARTVWTDLGGRRGYSPAVAEVRAVARAMVAAARLLHPDTMPLGVIEEAAAQLRDWNRGGSPDESGARHPRFVMRDVTDGEDTDPYEALIEQVLTAVRSGHAVCQDGDARDIGSTMLLGTDPGPDPMSGDAATPEEVAELDAVRVYVDVPDGVLAEGDTVRDALLRAYRAGRDRARMEIAAAQRRTT